MFCNGIILSNGPQIDPGYCGRLLCLLYNTSSKDYLMQPNSNFHFASIQFQSLSSSTAKPYNGRWNRKKSVKDYIAQYVDQGVSDKVKTIQTLQERTSNLDVMVNDHTSSHKYSQLAVIGFSAIALGVTFLSILIALIARSEYVELIKSNTNNTNQISKLELEISKINEKLKSRPYK